MVITEITINDHVTEWGTGYGEDGPSVIRFTTRRSGRR